MCVCARVWIYIYGLVSEIILVFFALEKGGRRERERERERKSGGGGRRGAGMTRVSDTKTPFSFKPLFSCATLTQGAP